MQKPTIVALAVLGLLGASAFLLGPQLLGGGSVPTMRWDDADQLELVQANAPDGGDPVTVDAGADAGPRQQLAASDDEFFGFDPGERAELRLHGRVVDRYGKAVEGARVWLDFGRGGARIRPGGQRRVPDAVATDADGRFAFQGQAFRNLRVNLLVVHDRHAPAQFDKNLGEVGADQDLGELVVLTGGQLLGRVTDLDGIGVPGAEVRLQPQNDNRMRFARNRDEVLPAATVDNNGYYRFDHVAPGDWRAAATAARHQSGSSDIVEALDEQRVDVGDIRLGPGFEITGVVVDDRGGPVADADVEARVRRAPGDGGDRGGRPTRGGRGGRGDRGDRGGPPFAAFGNDQRTRTDAKGRFVLEHLPAATVDLTVRKDGLLTGEVADLDSTAGQPVYVTLHDGLRITGVVTDAADSLPVSRFKVDVQWVRSLPTDLENNPDWTAMLDRLREDGLDDQARRELRMRIEDMRSRFRGNGGPPGRRPGRGAEIGAAEMTEHEGGTFVETGLQEGVYTVTVRTEEHAPFRSEEIELRSGQAAPRLLIGLHRGHRVDGLVRDAFGDPVAGATVTLRAAEPDELRAGPGDQPFGAPGGGPGGRNRGAMRQFFAAFGSTTAEATTDREGRYSLLHIADGRYRVMARAKGFAETRTDPFPLAGDLPGVDLELTRLGSLGGRILDATPADLGEVRVVAVPIGEAADIGAMFRGGGGRPFAAVHDDGTYTFAELAAGDYAVRAFTGNGMRDLFGQFANGEMRADVRVDAGAAATFDVRLAVSLTGRVNGSVLHNGAPAPGFAVTLRSADDATATAEDAGSRRGGPFRPGFGGQNAETDAQGRFHLDDVPVGTWELVVSAEPRGGALHRETVFVTAQTTAEVHVAVSTAAVEGEVTATDGTPQTSITGSVMLLPGITAMPTDLQGVRPGSDGVFRARVQAGRFSVDQIPPGAYLAILTARGRERSGVLVQTTLGQRTSVTLPLGTVRADSAATPQAQPRRGN